MGLRNSEPEFYFTIAQRIGSTLLTNLIILGIIAGLPCVVVPMGHVCRLLSVNHINLTPLLCLPSDRIPYSQK